MTEARNVGSTWMSLDTMAIELVERGHIRKLVEAGIVEIGCDPLNALFINRQSWERSIVTLPIHDAIARIDSWSMGERAEILTITAAAAQAGVSTKTLRHEILNGNLTAQRKGKGRKSPYIIARQSLRSWMDQRRIDARDLIAHIIT